MIVKLDLFRLILIKMRLTPEKFGDRLKVAADEVYKMLGGKKVGVYTSRRFIKYLSAECAQYLIDWDKLGLENPLKQ